MIVESVGYKTCVVLTCSDDVALILCQLIAEGRETTLDAAVHEVQATLEGVGLLLHTVQNVLLSQLVFVTHLNDVLLGLAAAVLQLLNNVQISQVCSVDDTLAATSSAVGTLTVY